MSAYISLEQYVHGLKKRGHWRISKALLLRIIKIALASVLMGGSVFGLQKAMLYALPDIYEYSWLIKCFWLGVCGTFGLIVFLIFIHLFGIFRLSDFRSLLKRKKTTEN